MTARYLHETIPRLVHPGRVPVHAAQYASLGDTSHDGGPRVPVGRREAAWRVGHLEADYGLAGGVLEGVIIEDFDGLAWPGAEGCQVLSIRTVIDVGNIQGVTYCVSSSLTSMISFVNLASQLLDLIVQQVTAFMRWRLLQ